MNLNRGLNTTLLRLLNGFVLGQSFNDEIEINITEGQQKEDMLNFINNIITILFNDIQQRNDSDKTYIRQALNIEYEKLINPPLSINSNCTIDDIKNNVYNCTFDIMKDAISIDLDIVENPNKREKQFITSGFNKLLENNSLENDPIFKALYQLFTNRKNTEQKQIIKALIISNAMQNEKQRLSK